MVYSKTFLGTFSRNCTDLENKKGVIINSLHPNLEVILLLYVNIISNRIPELDLPPGHWNGNL